MPTIQRCPRDRSRFLPLALLALAVLGLDAGALEQQPPATPAVILVTGARVLDVSAGRYLPPAAVLIENGRISSVSATEPKGVPPSARRLALTDATLVPGLLDVHASAAPTAGFDADYFYQMGLAHGVTGYRVLNMRTAWAAAQKRRVAAGLVVAPRLWVSGRGIDRGARPDLWLFDAPDAALAAGEAARQIAAAIDWIAGYDNLPADAYRALMAAANGTPVRVSGTPGAASMADLSAAGLHSIETLAYPLTARKAAAGDAGEADRAWLEAQPRDLATLVQQLVRARTTLVPMMAGSLIRAYPDEIKDSASLALLPEASRATLLASAAGAVQADTDRARRVWTSQASFLARFVKAGGRVASGTGFDLRGYPPPGVGVHAELAALVRAGLTPPDAIRAATTHAVALLGAEKELGAIAPGLEADFFAVQGDPLANVADLARITHVIRRGEVMEPKVLLAAAQRSAASRR